MRDLYACRLPVEGDGAEAFDQLLDLITQAVAGGLGAEALGAPEGSLALEDGEGMR